MVLGHNWLTCYNPLIDWVLGSISFCSTNQEELLALVKARSVYTPFLMQSNLSSESPQLSPTISKKALLKPHVSLINGMVFQHASCLPESEVFSLNLGNPRLTVRATTSASDPKGLESIRVEYHQYSDVFSKSRADSLAPHRPYDLKISMEEGASVPAGPIYSFSATELEKLHEFIDENLSTGFIGLTNSLHSAPVLFVKKKDSSLRLCVDYSSLNRVSKKDCYRLPLIMDLLDAPKRSCIYLKIDLCHAYHLVRIAEGDEWKMAFQTHYGSFEWLVMPFGLTNALASFQRFMNNIFSDMLDVFALIYLDDILIFSDNIDQHRKHIKEVLSWLRKHGLYARGDKCEFHKTEVEFLRYIISADGLQMSEDKVKTILSWLEPRKVKDVQSFLGFANFYRHFIDAYSELTFPLTYLTKKGVSWNWSSECWKAFEAIKQAFTSAPVLTHWVPDALLVVGTNTSNYALAAILSIVVEGKLHPVTFHSWTFFQPERNYDVHDKELLAIFEAFKKWCHYLEGSATPIDMVTDHKNLD